MDASFPADRVRALVQAFQGFDFDNPCRRKLEQFRSPAIIFSRQGWEAVKTELTIRETIVLAKALTVLEREFEWTGGSGAAAIWIVKDLLDRQPKEGKFLADWIVDRTRNGYLRLACDGRASVRMWVSDLSGMFAH